jgi:hypothetical protein
MGRSIVGKAEWFLGAALFVLGCGVPGTGADEEQVAVERSALTNAANRALLITMTSVTRDPARTEDPCTTTAGDENKVWTIGHMLKREAQKRGLDPQTYVNNWIGNWTASGVVVNGDTIEPRQGPVVRTSWQTFSGSTTLNLYDAPFYLLAIANRIDLRQHRPFGQPLGGEIRFVFGMLTPTTTPPACPSTEFNLGSTIILEYSPNKATENDVQDLARRWLALETLTGTSYNSALETLTEEVINAGKLLRIRANEVNPEGTFNWQLTEFEHNASGFLVRSTIKQSPSLASGNTQGVTDYIMANRTDLSANAIDVDPSASTSFPIGDYVVPDLFPGTSTFFRGGRNFIGNAVSDFWNPPDPGAGLLWYDLRFRFAVGTCLGCHARETNTSFLHIEPRTPGTEATRSPFLSGPISVDDPLAVGLTRQFDEMGRREKDQRNLVSFAPVGLPVLKNNYTIRFANSGRCLDSAGNTTTNGAVSQIWDCHGNANQRLSFVSLVPGNLAGPFNVKYKHSGKCLDIQGGSTASGARVIQNTCNGSSTSQKLALDDVASGPSSPLPRVLRFQHSGLCLMVQNQGTANGTAVVQAACPTQPSQGFNLVE